MDRDTEERLDQALAALASEVREASPRPGPELTARIIAGADNAFQASPVSDAEVDAALTTLAREVKAASARPGPDLVARVLADASGIIAERPAPTPQKPARRPSSAWTWAFGWTSGAAVAMAMALVIGIGVGMQMDPAEMTLLGDQTGMALSMVDDGFMLEDML